MIRSLRETPERGTPLKKRNGSEEKKEKNTACPHRDSSPEKGNQRGMHYCDDWTLPFSSFSFLSALRL